MLQSRGFALVAGEPARSRSRTSAAMHRTFKPVDALYGSMDSLNPRRLALLGSPSDSLHGKSDDALMELTRDGTHRAFQVLVLRHQARVLRVASRYLRDRTLAADVAQNTLALHGIGCTACKVAAYTVADAIVAVGTVGLAMLTVESAPVVALAAFSGVATRTALLFIQGLGTAIVKGVTHVATEICKWTGSC